MSAHKWASRSSVITQLNRGRSSQSLDAQEPQNGARDDGTVCGIVPSRTHAARLDIGHLDNVLGHKWTSRSSVITQLNRGRSSQSLDAQEPQDGARDDGTIHLLKRIRRGEEGLDT